MKIQNQIRRLVSSLLMVFASGCCFSGKDSILTTQLIDAQSGESIPNAVTVIDREYISYQDYVDEVRKGGNVGKSGRATYCGLKTTGYWRTSIEFTSAGYYNAGIQVVDGMAKVYQRVPDSIAWEGQLSAPAEKDRSGAYLIRLYPNPNRDTDIRLQFWTHDPHNIFGPLPKWFPPARRKPSTASPEQKMN